MKYVPKLFRSKLVSGASIYLTANLFNAAIPFFLLPVLTRYLEPVEYGQVAVFMVWVSLMGALCGLSVHGAATRKYYDYDEPDREMGDFVTACLILMVMSSAVLFLVLVPILGLVAQLIGLSQGWLLIGVLFAFCNFLIQLRLGQWQVRNQPKKYGFFQVLQSTLNMVLSLLLVVALGLGVDGRLGGYTISIVIFGLIAIISMKKYGLIKRTWRPDLIKEAAKFGVPLIPHVLGAFLLLTVDRAVIGSLLGLDAAGYYMVAIQFSMVLALTLESINKAYVPWLYEQLKLDDINAKQRIVAINYGYFFFLILLTTGCFLFGKNIIVFIAGDDYSPAGDLVGWLILGQSFRGLYYMSSSYIFYAKKTGLIAKITIATGILNLCLLFIGVNSYGLVGAAYAMCFSMLLQWLITWYFGNRLVKMPWFRLNWSVLR